MQASLQKPAGQALARRTARRVAFTPAGRSLSVAVFAKKGKGRGIIRQSAGVSGVSGNVGPGGAGPMTMSKVADPEVDAEQAEYVLFVKAKNVAQGKITVKETQWFPLSIMKAGTPGTALAAQLETEFGRKLYSNVLIRQIAQGLYKDKEAMANSIRKGFPPLAEVPTKNFEYAFKIRDKTRPEAWKLAEDLVMLPPESEVSSNPLDDIKKFFSIENLATMFK